MSERSSAEIDAACPTCGPTATEEHPRHPRVIRCANCKEYLRVLPPGSAEATS